MLSFFLSRLFCEKKRTNSLFFAVEPCTLPRVDTPNSNGSLNPNHSWASASRKLTPASAFRHQYIQSGTGPKKCRTALAWSGTRLVPASFFFFILVPDCSDAGQSGIPAFIHSNTNTHRNMHSHTHAHLWCAAWTWTETWTFSMATKHGHGHWDGQHHGCRNADKFLVRHH
jgi:hypothetical protein